MKTCTIDWCDKKHFGIWLCSAHYDKNRKYWDPLICKTAWNWEDRFRNKLYGTYNGMKKRCYKENDKRYQYYWWRGIIVCDRWLWIDWFTNFLSDMWPRPDWYSLDRINVNWNYSPENCRWANVYQQTSNMTSNNKDVWVCKRHNKRQWKLTVKWIVYQKAFYKYDEAVAYRKKLEKLYL